MCKFVRTARDPAGQSGTQEESKNETETDTDYLHDDPWNFCRLTRIHLGVTEGYTEAPPGSPIVNNL